ncbi:fimbrial protein [Pseudomonas chlororaphis]|uniref:Fimbrial protein n=1 Tax=Pseudomonas chlororaphis TaxID=587753 RepID=A0A1Q8EM85_9PSED|nr:fimbrial protein [Pseudomonas chlororaphis]OLF52895.1 fimbrial protein [Pseudomonas chlororaphis]
MKRTHAKWWVAGILAMASTVLQAADVTITVNGRVVAKPCTVSTTNATVDFGDLYTFSLSQPGSASAWHSVSFDLTNCPVGTSKVTATFSGTTDSTGYYRNLGTAGNIQLELQDDGGTTLNNGTSKTVRVNESTQSARVPLQIRALTVNGRTTQGSIQAVINIIYTWA